ncbi:glycosyltransferase family 2 protein [Desemzia incerta]|uniref:glycosyltransferase family 2 protein n=1 Tax=Desemzia incerta TaxID=82801 RepID=UPI0024C28886|nr:glycosyltransferase family 2 protein [Desemzia incerta]WHZ31953.1 glycosyltransferase family 2 protein [Desemzia incerta]
MSKLVSIIVPVYNSEKYITDNLLSILNQSYKNLEAIMVDDGSTDNSAKIIKEIAEEDERVKYIKQENQGAPAARNKGLNHSNGDFIYFIDSDDRLAREAVHLMLESLEQTNTDIVIGQYQNMDETGELKDIQNFGMSNFTILETQKNMKKLAFLPPFPGNKMYRAAIIKNNKIDFAKVKIAQDLNFYLKALVSSERVTVIGDIVYYYRFRLGSISNTYTSSILDIKSSIDNVQTFYKKTNNYNKQLFQNIRFLYYSYQLSKIPQIKNKKERKLVFDTLKAELEAIPKANLYPSVYKKKYWNTKIKLSMKNVFMSNYYMKFQQRKRNKN